MGIYYEYVVSSSCNEYVVVLIRSYAPVTMCMPFSNVRVAANAWETCLQKVAPKHEDYFPVVDCMAARGCVEVRSMMHGMRRYVFVTLRYVREQGGA